VDTDGTADGEEDGAQSEDIENEEADDADAAVADNTETKSDAAPVTSEVAATADADPKQSSTSADADKPKDQESAVRMWLLACVICAMSFFMAFDFVVKIYCEIMWIFELHTSYLAICKEIPLFNMCITLVAIWHLWIKQHVWVLQTCFIAIYIMSSYVQ